MAQTTLTLSALLAPGLRKIYFDTWQRRPPEFKNIARVVNTTRAYEEERLMGGLGLLRRKEEGISVSWDVAVQGALKRHIPLSWGLGFRVTEEAYDDDLYNIINKLPAGLARSTQLTMDIEFGAMLDDMFTGAVYTTADGQPICSTAHVLANGQTYANCPSPHVDLSLTALRAAHVTLWNTPDERGHALRALANKLIVTPGWEFVAQEIIGSEKTPYTADNQPNSTQKVMKLTYGVQSYGSDEDAWFLQGENHNITCFMRKNPTTKSSDDFDTGDLKFKTSCRWVYGATDWREWYGSSGGA